MIEIAPSEYWLYNVSWYDATFYCLMLSVNGTSHWRLPTVQDVYSGSDLLNVHNILVPQRTVDPDNLSLWIWTSDNLKPRQHAYQIDLLDLEAIWYPMAYDHSVIAIPVRTVDD